MTLDAVTEGEGPEVLDVNGLLDTAEPDAEVEEQEATEPEAPAEKPAKGKAAAKPAAAKVPAPTAAKAPAAAPASDDLSDLVGDGVTFTPETLKKGAARVIAQAKAAQELVKKSHNLWGSAEKRAGKIQQREQHLQQREQTFGAQAQQLQASFNAIRSGDAKTALEGLRLLSGRDPVAWLEELNLHVASNGKKKPKAPEVLELEQRLERFEQAERHREAQAEERRAQAFIAQREAQLSELATSSVEDYPLVAEFAEENPDTIGAALAEIIVNGHARGKKVGDLDAVRMLEEQLQHQSELSERARTKREKRTADSASGTGTGSPGQQAKPGTAQSPTVKGKSLSSAAITAPAVKRELTDEELAEDSANFLPPALLRFSRGEF